MKPTHTKRQWTRAEADAVIRNLGTMSGSELRLLWDEVFGVYCYSHRRSFIRRRLEWRINTLVSGGLSERAMKRAEEIMDETLLRLKARAFKVSAPEAPRRTIHKYYRGEEHEVLEFANYWEYRGKRYSSLSAVATGIAGYHTSGSKFFGVYLRKGDKR